MAVQNPILVFDSGLGGLPYFARIQALLPQENYVYFADRDGFPYGKKTRAELITLVRSRISKLVNKYNPKIIVIACNTASQSCLEDLRSHFPQIPFVGTVPAVKLAAMESTQFAVMATEGTIADPYLEELIKQFAHDKHVIKYAAQSLVQFVEQELCTASPEQIDTAVERALANLPVHEIDTVVLACTHFLHIYDSIEKVLKQRSAKPIRIVDSNEGVARRTLSLLHSRREINVTHTDSAARFVLTGNLPFENNYFEYARRFKLSTPELL